MKWIQEGNRYLSNPYQIVSNVLGYECWLRTKDRYCVLMREIPTLREAKEFCEVDAGKRAAVSAAEPAAARDGIGV